MSDCVEEWRVVSGYEGEYEVSNLGNVRSYVKMGGHGGLNAQPHPLCKNSMSGHHYPAVGLRGHPITVHTLVAKAFLRPRNPGEEVRHLDGNPKNNRADNLAWGTRAENMQDMIRHGHTTRGERSAQSKISNIDTIHIRQLYGAGLPQDELAAMYGLSRPQITRICNGSSRRYIQ